MFVALDTETTGFSPDSGDRIIEVAALVYGFDGKNRSTFHAYVDPEREVHFRATQVHGMSWSSLKGKPKFSAIANDLLNAIRGRTLVIHNAPFDLPFLNAEFGRVGITEPIERCCKVVDTLEVSRRVFATGGHKLDDLCARLGIVAERPIHGAKIDAQILALAYIELVRRFPHIHPR